MEKIPDTKISNFFENGNIVMIKSNDRFLVLLGRETAVQYLRITAVKITEIQYS
jgi:hypothetical protein